MRKIKKDELLNNSDFAEQFAGKQRKIDELIRSRKIPARSHLEFQFLNPEILLWELQVLLKDQDIVRDDLIDAELADINRFVPGQGALCCRLNFSFTDSKERAEKLMAWKKLPEHVSLYTEGNKPILGKMIYPDELDRDSRSVLFHFEVGVDIPEGLKVTLPGVELDYKFSSQLRDHLKEDLHTDL